MASRGSRFKRLSVDDAVAEILADLVSELIDLTANCVSLPAPRTFIQRRIMHKLERQEETAHKISCMYLCSFYFNFSVENGKKSLKCRHWLQI
jgi:hypothetical protein